MKYVPKNAPPGSVVFNLVIAVKGWGASTTVTDKGKWYTPEEFADEITKWTKRMLEYSAKAHELARKESTNG